MRSNETGAVHGASMLSFELWIKTIHQSWFGLALFFSMCLFILLDVWFRSIKFKHSLINIYTVFEILGQWHINWWLNHIQCLERNASLTFWINFEKSYHNTRHVTLYISISLSSGEFPRRKSTDSSPAVIKLRIQFLWRTCRVRSIKYYTQEF